MDQFAFSYCFYLSGLDFSEVNFNCCSFARRSDPCHLYRGTLVFKLVLAIYPCSVVAIWVALSLRVGDPHVIVGLDDWR
jgi:hypothetical protein